MWGASVISAPETSQGLRVSNQSCGFGRVAVRGRAMGLIITSAQGGKLLKYERRVSGFI